MHGKLVLLNFDHLIIRYSDQMTKSTLSRSDLMQAIIVAIMRWQDATALFDEEIGTRLGLSKNEQRCLGALVHGPRPAREIAVATRLTRAAVTTLLDRLENRGLLTRQQDKADRRQVLIALTQKARELNEAYYGPIAAKGARFLASLTTAELNAALKFLEGAMNLQLSELDELRAVRE